MDPRVIFFSSAVIFVCAVAYMLKVIVAHERH